jgi:hypothetical protein
MVVSSSGAGFSGATFTKILLGDTAKTISCLRYTKINRIRNKNNGLYFFKYMFILYLKRIKF